MLRLALRRFDSIWIPDVAGSPNLSGELSHPPLKGFETNYLGLISRFKAKPVETHTQDPNAKVVVILSGPEPQRTYLEQILMEQALPLPHKFVFVKGKTHAKEHHRVGENLEVISYLASEELNRMLQTCQVVICRAGYSSLMDLAALGGIKAILIPTPGQTEQEYLGEVFARQGIFVCQKQEQIDLEFGLQAIEKTTGFLPEQFEMEHFEKVLEKWLLHLPEALTSR